MEMKFVCCRCLTRKQGRICEDKYQFERLLGGMHGKYAMAEFSKSDRGDETYTVSFSELIHGPHFRGSSDWTFV
ncbi:hypothetical protein ACET3Z_004957 [Daucus carota]